jgi:putative FmdB family regulatory protein
MPTYQYRCKQCDHELEVVQSFSDEPLTTCPECEGALKKVYGNVGISFKGSGFYKTDSRGGSSKKAAAPKSDTSSDSTTTATKSEPSSGGDKAAASSTSSTSSSD